MKPEEVQKRETKENKSAGSAKKGRTSARFSFAVSAPFAFPKGRQKAQKLQKIFSVAAGDHAYRPVCSAESDF